MPKNKSSWEWLCNSKESIQHEENCKDSDNCEKCVAILATSVAMEEYGRETPPEPDEMHPLFDMIVDTFNGHEVN